MSAATRVIVLGAGASGLVCAAAAAGRGHAVRLLDAGTVPARKLAVSGGGRCNFTNLAAAPAFYLGKNPDFARSALARFSPEHIVRMFGGMGITPQEKAPGQLFARQGGQAVAGALVSRCRELGVDLLASRRVDGVVWERSVFTVYCAGEGVTCDRLVVATGGLSWPRLGVSGLGFDLAARFGIAVVPPRPALTPFLLAAGHPFAGLAGISLTAEVSVGGRGFTDGLLFTHQGLSGPAALNASCFWNPGEPLAIDFLPGRSLAEILDRASSGRELVKNRLARHLPARLAARLVPDDLAARRVADLAKADMARLEEAISRRRIVPTALAGYDLAEVTAGGVDVGRIDSKTMGARDVPGLFFTGEVLDVTGLLGGFNLQWAFASGLAAGEGL